MLLTLLSEGGDPNICRIDGASSLWIASQMGHDHIVRVLLKNGARVDAVRCVSSFILQKIISAIWQTEKNNSNVLKIFPF